jgi:hypothetical protein
MLCALKCLVPTLQIEEQPVDDLMDLVKQIVPFHVKVWRGLLKHLRNALCVNFASALRLEILSCGLALSFL